MSDRINSLLVVLDNDMRDDDVQGLIDAIKKFRNVNSVTGNVTDHNTHVAHMRERARINDALLELVKSGI